MQVIAHDIVEDHDWAARHNVRYVGYDELLSESQALTIHLPYTPQTENMVSRAAMAQLPAGAFVINTCRGEVLDEAALYDALKDGHLGGAAIDVYHQEPYTGPLASLPNVFLTCHQGSCSHDGRYLMEVGSASNAVAFAHGKQIPPANIVWLPGMPIPERLF